MRTVTVSLLSFVVLSLCACNRPTAVVHQDPEVQVPSIPPTAKTPFRGSDLENTCLKMIDKHSQEALAVLNQAEDDYKEDYNFVSLKAVCYAVLGLEDSCLKQIDAAMALASTEKERSELFHVQGKMLFALRNFAALQIASEKAVTVIPKDADEWVYLASAYNQQQKFEKGVKAAQTALRLNPASGPKRKLHTSLQML